MPAHLGAPDRNPAADEYIFEYKSVPKLYGLMQGETGERSFDPNSLIVSGITQVQREPLSLTGITSKYSLESTLPLQSIAHISFSKPHTCA